MKTLCAKTDKKLSCNLLNLGEFSSYAPFWMNHTFEMVLFNESVDLVHQTALKDWFGSHTG